MKILTLAAVAIVALLGFFIVGCDESQTMMEQVTRETSPAPEEEVTVKETQPTPEEVPPAAPRVLRGEELVRATVCKAGVCFVGVSYTNEWNPDNTGRLTLYFDIPDALGAGPHRVLLRHPQAHMETDIPFKNKQVLAGKEHSSYHELLSQTYTEGIVFLDSDDKIVFNYRMPLHHEEVQLAIGDAISDYAPGAVSIGDPNQEIWGWDWREGVLYANYPYWKGEAALYTELFVRFYGGIYHDFYGD